MNYEFKYILVLMEDGLRVSVLKVWKDGKTFVLILVLMEDGLRDNGRNRALRNEKELS